MWNLWAHEGGRSFCPPARPARGRFCLCRSRGTKAWKRLCGKIDLDGFKKINDTLGHAVGDQVLQQVANTLRANLRITDAVARLGGDEFAILLTETSAVSAEKVLRKLHELLRTAMRTKGWNVDFSIGLASYACPPESVDDIMRVADGVMYSVKTKGKGNVAVALLA